VVGGRANERGVVSAASYAARKFGVHSAMPLRTAAKLCPQAIFVEGHPNRYREYSAKVYEVLGRFFPQAGDGLHRRSLRRHDRHRTSARSATARGPRLAPRDESRNAIELLHRNRHFTVDRKGLLRPGQAEWRSLDHAGQGSRVSGAPRCAQDPWRRQGYGETPARERHHEGR